MDIQPLLAYNTWLSLPSETRQKLEKLFDIPRSGEVVVRVGQITPQGNIGGEATSDGHSAKDLYAITVEKMQKLLGREESYDNFHRLFGEILEKIDELPIVAPPLVQKKRGRKPKKDGKATK